MKFPTTLAKKGMLLTRVPVLLILTVLLLSISFIPQAQALGTFTASLTTYSDFVLMKNYPTILYDSVVLRATNQSINGANFWVNQDIDIQNGGAEVIFTSMTWTNTTSTRVTSSLVGLGANYNPVKGGYMNIQNLSLYNVALDPQGDAGFGRSPVMIKFQPLGGAPSSLTMSNASIVDATYGIEGYAPSAFTLTASGATNQINLWSGSFNSPTTLVVTNGATLIFNYCGDVSSSASVSQRLNFGESGNAINIAGAGSTLVIGNSALQFYTNDLSSSMLVHDGGTIQLYGYNSQLRLPSLTLDNGTLWMSNNTIVSLKEELLLTNNSTVFVGNGAVLSSTFVTAASGGSSTITVIDPQDGNGLFSGELFMSGNSTLTINGTGNMVLTNGGIGAWTGTNNQLRVVDSAALKISGVNSVFNPQGSVLIDPMSPSNNAQIDIRKGAGFFLSPYSKITNNGLIDVEGQGSEFRVYGSGTVSGNGSLLLGEGASLLFRADSNRPVGQGLLVTSNAFEPWSHSTLAMTLDPLNLTNDRIITPVIAIAQFGEATLTLSATNDTFLPVNTKFLLIDHSNYIPTAVGPTAQTFDGLPQGGYVRVGQNLYEIFYNDTTAGAIGGYGIVLNSIFNIYDSYWATNIGGNWTNNPYWGTLGTNIGVAPGLTSPYGGWDTATFDIRGLTSGIGTVTLNTNAQLSAMVFSNAAASYAIGGSGTITMGTGEQNPFIFNFAGNHSIGVTMNLATNTTIFTDTGSILTLSGPIIGAGGISALGVGTLTLTGNNTYTGPTTLVGGTLQLLGTHTGGATYTVTLGNLTGTGTTTSKVNGDGGSITPGVGNTPGTLSVGSLVIGTSGTFNVLIASTSNVGQVSATGSAVVGGTLNAIPVNGWNLNFGDRYQILTAGGGISGNFGTIAVPQGYRGRFLVENGGTTGVLLIAPQSYTQVAVTRNQSNVASALNNFISATSGDKQVVSTALDSLKGSAAYQQAFNAISPQFYQSLSTIAFNAANAQYNDLVQQMFGLRVAGTGFSMSGFADNTAMMQEGQGDGDKGVLDSKKDILRPGADTHWGMFVDGNGIFAQANSGNMLPGYNAQSGGLITGLTYKWNPAVTTGIYAGYEGTYAKFGYPYSGSTVIDNAVRFGLLGTFGDPSGKGFYGDALVGGTYNNYSVSRVISFPGINRTANSSPGAGELDSLIAAGYNWRKGNWAFGPVSSLQYTYFGMNSFSETGAQSLDYQGLNWNSASMIYNLGANCAYSWRATRNLMVVPQINLAWQHEFLQNPYAINGTLGGASVSNWSATPLRDTIYTGVGVTLEFRKRWNTAFFYNAAAGNSDLVSQNIFWSVGVKF